MTRNPVALTVGVGLVAVGVLGWLLWPSPQPATVLHSGHAPLRDHGDRRPAPHRQHDVTVDVSPRDGAAARDVTVEAVMPLMGFATPPAAAVDQGGRRTASGVPLMMTGPWELYVSVTGRDGSTDTAMVPFTVSG